MFSNNQNRTVVFNMSSCPNGYHVLFVCKECKIMVRNDAVSCPHVTRLIDRKQPHAFFFSAITQATDMYMHMENALVNIT